MIETGLPTGPVVDARGVAFAVSDPGRTLRRVRLVQEIGLPARAVEFLRMNGRWRLRIPRGSADRLEYLLEAPSGRRFGGGRPRPGQPAPRRRRVRRQVGRGVPRLRASGMALGGAAAGCPTRSPVAVHDLGMPVTGSVWTAPWAGSRRPRTAARRARRPGYDRLAELTRFLAVCVADGTVPPPAQPERNRWYAADPAYSRALLEDVLPACRRAGASAWGPVWGALAMLHAYRQHPAGFAGLFLQSGSFFTETLDPQERRFPRFAEITRFVAEVHDAGVTDNPSPSA